MEFGTFEMKERFGLYAKDGASEGIFKDNPEDCIFWFSNGQYFDPTTPGYFSFAFQIFASRDFKEAKMAVDKIFRGQKYGREIKRIH